MLHRLGEHRRCCEDQRLLDEECVMSTFGVAHLDRQKAISAQVPAEKSVGCLAMRLVDVTYCASASILAMGTFVFVKALQDEPLQVGGDKNKDFTAGKQGRILTLLM